MYLYVDFLLIQVFIYFKKFFWKMRYLILLILQWERVFLQELEDLVFSFSFVKF